MCSVGSSLCGLVAACCGFFSPVRCLIVVLGEARAGPEVIKLFMLNSAEHEIFHSIKSQITINCNYFLLNISECENFSANKYENANFLFISKENFMLS